MEDMTFIGWTDMDILRSGTNGGDSHTTSDPSSPFDVVLMLSTALIYLEAKDMEAYRCASYRLATLLSRAKKGKHKSRRVT